MGECRTRRREEEREGKWKVVEYNTLEIDRRI